MCRWLAYSGPEIYLEDLIIKALTLAPCSEPLRP